MQTFRALRQRTNSPPSLRGVVEGFSVLRRFCATRALLALCILFPAASFAQVACTGTPTATCITAIQNQSCAGTRFGGNLGCTANDVSASLSFTQPAANTLANCVAGTDVVIDLVANLGSGMPNRYDLGIFIGQTGNDPQLFNAANQCSLGVFPTSSTFSTAFYNDPADNDSCGDFKGGFTNVPLLIQGVKIRCLPSAGTSSVGLPFVLSWSQSTNNNGNYATCSAGLAPGTTSKCSTSPTGTQALVTNIVVNGYINLTKATLPNPDVSAQAFSFTAGSTTGTPTPSTKTLTNGQTQQFTVPYTSAGTANLIITEALAPFWEPGVTITCTAGAGSGNPTTVNNATRVITATFTSTAFGADCTITNSKKPRVTIAKTIVARAVASDQFTVSANGGGILTDDAGTGTLTSPVSTTTSGVSLTTSTTFRSSPATLITIAETAASGLLTDYVTTFVCTNATAGSATVMPSGAATTFGLTPAAGDDITCTFSNTPKPILTKAFSPASIATGGTSTLTFIITNLTAAAAQNITFTDTFPTNLVIAATPAVANGCGGSPTITATAGTSIFTVGGAGVTAAVGPSTCTISVNVTSSVTGAYTNGAAQITASSANLKNGVTNQVVSFYIPPTVTKSFTPSVMTLGSTSSMVITVTNPAANPGNLTGVSINDIYTGTLQNNAAGNVVCSGAGSATLSGGVNGGTSVGLTAGTIVPSGTCTITQSVTATSTNTNTTTAPSATGPTALTGSTASATLTVGNAIGVTKSFGTNPVAINTNSLLTIALTNTNAIAATAVAFTDTYPAGLVNNGLVSNTCGGTVTVSALATNPGVTSLSSGTIPANSSCVITVNTQSGTNGAYTNTLAVGSVTSSNTPANTAAASDTLLVGRAKLDKSFSGALTIGGTITLTYQVIHTSALAVSFTDTLPAGLRVASPSTIGGNCSGGTVTATALSNTITVAGRNSVNGTCTITVNITTAASPTAGSCPQANNTNGNSNISATTNIGADITDSAAGGGTISTGTGACVTVLAFPTLSKAFTPASIASGGSSTLTVTLGNSNASAITLTSALTDNFPAGVTIGTAGNTGTCSGVTATAGATSFTVANGTSIAATTGCTVVVNVTSSTVGAATNTIPIGALTTSAGNNAAAASATLTVLTAPTITKAFTPASIASGGSSTLTVTLGNSNASAITLTSALTDNFPTTPGTGMFRAATPSISTTCASGTVSSTSGSVTLTGGTVPANSSCTFQIDVTASTAGIYNNTIAIGALTTNAGSNTAAATASLTVNGVANVGVSKNGPATIAWGTTITYTSTVTNAGPDAANLTVFTDVVPAGITGVTASCGTPTMGAACGAVTVTGNNISSTITTLPSGGTVTFTIQGTAPQTGTLVNSATAIVPTGISDPDDPSRTGAGNNTSAPVSTVVQAPDLAITKTASTTSFTVGTNASFILTPNNLTGNAATVGTITVTDVLPTGLTYIAAGSGGTGWTCTAAGQTITCTTSSIISAGGTGNPITINVGVAGGAAPAISNVATVAGSNEPAANTGNNSATLNVNVGSATVSTFTTDGAQTGTPGSAVFYTHTFTAGSAGSVSFATASTPSPNIAGWGVTVFRDTNCNGALDGAEGSTALSTSVAVIAGDQVCIIIKSSIPNLAPYNAQDSILVTATFTPSVGPVVSLNHQDITTVGAVGGAGLVLTKAVRNITQGGALGTTNTARPGEVLEYVITYNNTSGAALSMVVISDNTPAYTIFLSASCAALPMNITACSATTQPAVGGAGNIQWTLTGSLNAMQSGSVLFRVTVQ